MGVLWQHEKRWLDDVSKVRNNILLPLGIANSPWQLVLTPTHNNTVTLWQPPFLIMPWAEIHFNDMKKKNNSKENHVRHSTHVLFITFFCLSPTALEEWIDNKDGFLNRITCAVFSNNVIYHMPSVNGHMLWRHKNVEF